MSKAEQKNYMYCMETLEKLNAAQTEYLERAKELYEIKNLSLYRPSWDSFEEYCMEIKGLKYKSVMKLINVHEKFVLEYNFAPARVGQIGWTAVAELLPLITKETTKKKAGELLELAESQTRSDLRKTLMEIKTGIEMPKCAHKDTYTVCICRNCKDRWTVYDDKHVGKR